MKKHFWIPFLIFSIIFVNIGLAGTISITATSTSTIFDNNQGNITLKIVNSGDEAAHNVKLNVISDIVDIDKINAGVLEPNSPFETTIEAQIKDNLLPGTYSNVLLIEYEDANGYGFSAVSPILINNEEASRSEISGFFSPLILTDNRERRMELDLVNEGSKPHEISVKMITSNDLGVKGPERSFYIGPDETKKVEFKISNLSGLDGSKYVVMALVEYEDLVHHSNLINGFVEIGSSTTQEPFQEEKTQSKTTLVIIGLVLFASVTIIILYFQKNLKIEIKRKVKE